jgi:hypothetical protein
LAAFASEIKTLRNEMRADRHALVAARNELKGTGCMTPEEVRALEEPFIADIIGALQRAVQVSSPLAIAVGLIRVARALAASDQISKTFLALELARTALELDPDIAVVRGNDPRLFSNPQHATPLPPGTFLPGRLGGPWSRRMEPNSGTPSSRPALSRRAPWAGSRAAGLVQWPLVRFPVLPAYRWWVRPQSAPAVRARTNCSHCRFGSRPIGGWYNLRGRGM